MAAFELRDHTADVAVAARGDSLGATFGAVADGLAAAMCDDWPAPGDADGGDRRELTVAAEGREAALYDYLDELIYERDVHGVLPVDNEAAVERVDAAASDGEGGDDEVEHTDERWRVAAGYRGVPLSAVTARDVKAVTYSQMSLTETDSGWRAYVVFDV